MAIVATAEVPGVTHEMYDHLNEQLGITPDNPPDGLVYHLALDTDDGMRVLDVWESADKFNSFIQSNLATMQEAGVPPFEPRIMPVYNMLTGAGTQPNVAVMIEAPEFTPQQYDDVASRMKAHEGDGSNHPSVTHTAAVSGGGLFIVDVWDSPESFQRFAESQIAEAAGAEIPMEISIRPVYNRIEGKARVTA